MTTDTPIPIDNSTLPFERTKAVPCWQFNLHRAAFDRYGCSPVDKVWATKRVKYRRDPSDDGHSFGSQSIGVLYATEAEAWEACILAVEEAFDERLDKLRAEAKAAGETNDH